MAQDQPDANDLAIARTVMANERTFQAWVRTGLASLVTGLGVARFLQGSFPSWILLTIALTLFVLSALAFYLAVWRYTHLHLRLTHLDVPATPLWAARIIGYTLILCSIMAIAGLLFTSATY